VKVGTFNARGVCTISLQVAVHPLSGPQTKKKQKFPLWLKFCLGPQTKKKQKFPLWLKFCLYVVVFPTTVDTFIITGSSVASIRELCSFSSDRVSEWV
jgi:hypothetical protein